VSTCAHPLPFETLAALWSDPDAEGSAEVEQHLFACDECAARSHKLAKLVGGLRESIPAVISHDHRDRLVRGGRRIRNTLVDPRVEVHAHFTRDVDLLVHVLRGDLSKAEHVDVDVVLPDGSLFLRLEHVPFDAKAGEVLIACQRHYRELRDGDPRFRVHAVEGGVRRSVGEYLVVHHWE
jgi:hypothetical protein